jgi:hypothetical protein
VPFPAETLQFLIQRSRCQRKAGLHSEAIATQRCGAADTFRKRAGTKRRDGELNDRLIELTATEVAENAEIPSEDAIPQRAEPAKRSFRP